MSHNLIGANSFRETRSIFYPHHHPHAKPRFNFITSSHFISRNVYSTYYYSLFLLPNPPSLSSLSPSLSLTPSLSSSEQYTHTHPPITLQLSNESVETDIDYRIRKYNKHENIVKHYVHIISDNIQPYV